jgi:hypothetical protein
MMASTASRLQAGFACGNTAQPFLQEEFDGELHTAEAIRIEE